MNKQLRPPKLANRLLGFFLREKENSEKLGDLEEGFWIKAEEVGIIKAKLWYLWQTIIAIPVCLKNSITWGLIMFKNYFKIAFRNVLKQKGYSFINIFGLALGLSCSIFIFMWVYDELNFDTYNKNLNQLYRIEQDYYYSGETFHVSVTSRPCGPGLIEKIPEIINMSRYSNAEILVGHEDKEFYESDVAGIDSAYLDMFTLEFIRGDASTALNRPFSIIIDEEIAKKYFGNENALGKILTINNQYDFTVAGIFKKPPHNVSYSFKIAFPFDFLKTLGIYNEGWGSNYLYTIIQLVPNASIDEVNSKMTAVYRDNLHGSTNDLMLMPMKDLHLYSYFGFGHPTGDIQYIYMFAAIAIFVLLIACINFMNLTTARSIKRAKEIGLRKVVGANRSNLIAQFFGESILLSFIGLVFALVIVISLLGEFNELTNKEISLSMLGDNMFLLGVIAILLITGIVAGSYPALYLSSFKPASILQGTKARSVRGSNFRQILVVAQFSLSVFLIISTYIVYSQMTYMKHKDLGYDKENLVYIRMRGDLAKSYEAIKNELQHTNGIMSVSAASHPPYRIASNSGGADWDGKDPDQKVVIGINMVDYSFCKTMGIEVLAGRDFILSFPGDIVSDKDTVGGVVVNEEVVKLMGLTNETAIGARFDFFSYGNIIGVMKDFNYQSVKNEIEPLAMCLGPDYLRYIIIRLAPGNLNETLNNLNHAWSKIVTNYPFEYKFLDADLDNMYKRESRMLVLLRYFTILAIIIAGLGLIGLASFTAEQRTKEFGVRKVLGASGINLVRLISEEFVKLVIISNIIAWPITYYIGIKWLDKFAYRIDLGITVFLISGILSLLIAILSVIYHAIKAANTNPVNSLKYE